MTKRGLAARTRVTRLVGQLPDLCLASLARAEIKISKSPQETAKQAKQRIKLLAPRNQDLPRQSGSPITWVLKA